MSGPRIAALTVYPVKGCAGIALTRAPLRREGLIHDREWLIVDAQGRFVSQREHPALARIAVTLTDDGLALGADGHARVRVPHHQPGAGRRLVQVWNDRFEAIDCGAAASQWLSTFLGHSVGLVRFAPDQARPCDPAWVGPGGARVQFADAFPLLVLARESVADLGRRMGHPDLAWQRFRPNVLIEGVEPYEEDLIESLETGLVALRLVKPCTRCSVPSVDPILGVPTSIDPLTTLLGYRFDTRLAGATLGVNAVIYRGEADALTVGEPLQPTHRWDDT
ncbi:MAG: MOSC N-terminal beta barrel domain-containing protein [Burkholderiaceae bacterium]|nr:MOSC N-terminal beta barrel domain-containing protein [Burkholderiaceae bacterium]